MTKNQARKSYFLFMINKVKMNIMKSFHTIEPSIVQMFFYDICVYGKKNLQLIPNLI